MTENPPAPAAAIAVTTTKTRKHVTEGYDFWYNVCRIYEENDDNDPAKAKYKNNYSNFLDHEDSGPDVKNDKNQIQKMKRNYKKYKKGELKDNNGDRKRNRTSKFPLVEPEFLAEIDRLKAEKEPMLSWKGKALIANGIARNLGKKVQIKLDWAKGVLKRRKTNEATDDNASATPMQDVASPPSMSISPTSPAAVPMLTPNEKLMPAQDGNAAKGQRHSKHNLNSIKHHVDEACGDGGGTPLNATDDNASTTPTQAVTSPPGKNEHKYQSDLDKDLERYMSALTIQERDEPDSLTVAATYFKIGSVYYKKGNLDKALEHYQRALTIEERDEPDSLTVVCTHNNIASVYSAKGDLDKALEHRQRSSVIHARVAVANRRIFR